MRLNWFKRALGRPSTCCHSALPPANMASPIFFTVAEFSGFFFFFNTKAFLFYSVIANATDVTYRGASGSVAHLFIKPAQLNLPQQQASLTRATRLVSISSLLSLS